MNTALRLRSGSLFERLVDLRGESTILDFLRLDESRLLSLFLTHLYCLVYQESLVLTRVFFDGSRYLRGYRSIFGLPVGSKYFSVDVL